MGFLGWSDNELRLTKMDAQALLRRFLLGVGLLFFGFAALIATIFTLAESMIGALADYVHGNFVAGLIVSAALFAATALIIAIAYVVLTKTPPPKGMVFRRILGRRKDQ